MGYSGFRAVVDAGAVSRTPRQQAAFAEFELLIDRKMAVLPVSALCAFDREAAGAGADELACLHPWTGPGTGGFRLFAGTDPATVMLAGTVGAEEGERWSTVLARAWPWAPLGPVTVDAGRLERCASRRCWPISTPTSVTPAGRARRGCAWTRTHR